jgi:ubiquinone biosynthesis protein COQ9
MRIRDRITKAVRMRLELNAPHISTWAQALSLQATPSNAVFALQQRAALFDEIWHFMGTSVHYTSVCSLRSN